jgi:hypothetical protein
MGWLVRSQTARLLRKCCSAAPCSTCCRPHCNWGIPRCRPTPLPHSATVCIAVPSRRPETERRRGLPGQCAVQRPASAVCAPGACWPNPPCCTVAPGHGTPPYLVLTPASCARQTVQARLTAPRARPTLALATMPARAPCSQDHPQADHRRRRASRSDSSRVRMSPGGRGAKQGRGQGPEKGLGANECVACGSL